MARTKQTARKSNVAPLKIKTLRPQVAKALKRQFKTVGGIKKQENSKIKKKNEDANKPKKHVNQKSRTRIYRRLASQTCGFSLRSDSSQAATGIDSSKCLLNVSDARRLMRNHFNKDSSFRSKTQAKAQDMALKEGTPLTAARSATVHADALLRNIMLSAVKFSIAARQKKVTAAAVYHVLHDQMTRLASVGELGPAPVALVRHAQRVGQLDCTEADKKAIADEKKQAKKKRSNQEIRDDTREMRRKHSKKHTEINNEEAASAPAPAPANDDDDAFKDNED